MKLCNFRDCTTGNYKPCPHNAVDPCKVFRHAETGRWYDELTGQSIHDFRTENGTMFDVQDWLESQIIEAASVWEFGQIVHEVFRTKELVTPKPSRPAALAREHSGEELDVIADTFIRNKANRCNLIQDIQESGMELHGLIRMQRKWGDHPILELRIKEIREDRDELREIQSAMDTNSHEARNHLKNDATWINRWQPKQGCWNDFILICEFEEKILVIDRHGLKIDGQYIYLPDKDKKFFESTLWAEEYLGIIRTRWQRMAEPNEKIGASIRRHGKKNANGRRISARFEQTKYASCVFSIIKALRQMHVSVFRIRDDDSLFEYYLKNIAPKLNRK